MTFTIHVAKVGPDWVAVLVLSGTGDDVSMFTAKQKDIEVAMLQVTAAMLEATGDRAIIVPGAPGFGVPPV